MRLTIGKTGKVFPKPRNTWGIKVVFLWIHWENFPKTREYPGNPSLAGDFKKINLRTEKQKPSFEKTILLEKILKIPLVVEWEGW